MRQPAYTYRQSTFGGALPAGVKWILIINVLAFILRELLRGSYSRDIDLLSLIPYTVIHSFTVYQLVTYLFLHVDIWHLAFNMLALWMFGTPLERDWGTRYWLKYYFICGIGAGLFDVALTAATGHWNSATVGASGAIYGLLLAYGVCYPDNTVLMGFLFPVKAKYMVIIYAAVELYLSMHVNTGVSNIAHLGGLVVGFVYLKVRWPRVKWSLPDIGGAYRQWQLKRAKKKFQSYMRNNDRGPYVN
jgi:membrane associated rhomboid family serine protease